MAAFNPSELLKTTAVWPFPPPRCLRHKTLWLRQPVAGDVQVAVPHLPLVQPHQWTRSHLGHAARRGRVWRTKADLARWDGEAGEGRREQKKEWREGGKEAVHS